MDPSLCSISNGNICSVNSERLLKSVVSSLAGGTSSYTCVSVRALHPAGAQAQMEDRIQRWLNIEALKLDPDICLMGDSMIRWLGDPIIFTHWL